MALKQIINDSGHYCPATVSPVLPEHIPSLVRWGSRSPDITSQLSQLARNDPGLALQILCLADALDLKLDDNQIFADWLEEFQSEILAALVILAVIHGSYAGGTYEETAAWKKIRRQARLVLLLARWQGDVDTDAAWLASILSGVEKFRGPKAFNRYFPVRLREKILPAVQWTTLR